MIFTPDSEWFGQAGSAAYVDIFGSSFYDEPGWVFTDQLLYNNAPWAAEVASHDTGHLLGLNHDGNNSSEYYEGHGSGAVSWCAIRKAAYQVAVPQWSKGEYSDSDASNGEADLAIISGTRNGLSYRIDDHAGSTSSATPLTRTTGDAVSASGLIERTAEVEATMSEQSATCYVRVPLAVNQAVLFGSLDDWTSRLRSCFAFPCGNNGFSCAEPSVWSS